MSIRSLRWLVMVGFTLALASTIASAGNDEAIVQLTIGVDHTSGNYGGDLDIEDWYIPITGAIDYGRFGFRLTVPYLSVRAPSDTLIIEPGGEPVPG